MPETWFFYKAIVLLLLPKKWRLGRENFVLKTLRAISRVYFAYFLQSPRPASHPSLGKKSSEFGGRWEACGQRRSGPARAARGAPSLPPVGLRNSGGPGEVWKTELRHRLSFERWLQERGEGPPAVPSPPRRHPCQPAYTALESTQNAAQLSCSPRAGESIPRGSSPLQPAADIPTPTQGCRCRALSAVAECHCSLFLLIDQGRHSSRSIPHPKTVATARGCKA